MIDSAAIARLLGAAALLTLLLAGGVGAIWSSAALAGGLALGFGLGAAPFASWAWIASRAMRGVRTRALAAVLILAKLALYSLALWLLVSAKRVDPVGVFAGISAVVATVCAGSLRRAEPAKEAA
jgi:FtsH-binding integral membrane protein